MIINGGDNNKLKVRISISFELILFFINNLFVFVIVFSEIGQFVR